MLTLDKFEEASEKVKEVTLETKLVYSDFLSEQTGNKVYLKPENMQFTGAYKVRGAYYKISTLTETDPFWFVSGGFRVKGFFIISGFLVMFSFLRTPNTRIFFRKRIQRIMPAYSLTILLCALIGLFLTSLSCREYLTSSSLYTYLICNLLTFNFLSPDLPGVFDTNPLQAMNGSL